MTHSHLKLIMMLAAQPLCFVAPLGGCSRDRADTARPASSGSYEYDDDHDRTRSGSGPSGDSSRGMGSTGSNIGTAPKRPVRCCTTHRRTKFALMRCDSAIAAREAPRAPHSCTTSSLYSRE